MNEIILLFLEKIFEAIYFSMFLLIGKNIKEKRILFTLVMIFEYLLLTKIFLFNVWFQIIYTFLTYINLKVFYKKKAQITDIFLFTVSSIFLMIFSGIPYFLMMFTIKNYYLALIISRILIILFLILSKNNINKYYKKIYTQWNRHTNNKIKSLTLRNISIIIFNLMFYIINIAMGICLIVGRR